MCNLNSSEGTGRARSAVAVQDGCVLICSIDGFSYLYSVNFCVRETISEPLEKRLDSFEASLRFMSDKYEDMQRKLNQLEEQNRQLNFENKSLKFHVDTLTQNVRELESEIEEQQQYSRRDCLEFKNIPELEDESTNEIVVNVAELLGVNISHDDISISHRLPPSKPWKDELGNTQPPPPPPIIAKFVRRDVKDDVFQARFALKRKTTCDLVVDYVECEHNPIYISESLTVIRKKLFRSCLKFKKEFKLHVVSTSNGRIYIKEERKRRVYIDSEADLAKLRKQISTRSFPPGNK